jgi:hypothetical protein
VVDLSEFVRTGAFGPVSLGARQDDVVAAFGPPLILTPAHRSYPSMLVYGAVEFRLRADRVTTIALDLGPGERPDSPIEVRGLWPATERTTAAVDQLLTADGVTWRLDKVMSEPGAPVWVTDRGVHLAFTDDHLRRVGAAAG